MYDVNIRNWFIFSHVLMLEMYGLFSHWYWNLSLKWCGSEWNLHRNKQNYIPSPESICHAVIKTLMTCKVRASQKKNTEWKTKRNLRIGMIKLQNVATCNTTAKIGNIYFNMIKGKWLGICFHKVKQFYIKILLYKIMIKQSWTFTRILNFRHR